MTWRPLALIAAGALAVGIPTYVCSPSEEELDVLRDQIAAYRGALEEARENMAQVDSAAVARADSLKEAERQARTRARAAARRANLLADSLARQLPDSLQPVLASLRQAHTEEVAELDQIIAVKDQRLDAMEDRLQARNEVIARQHSLLRAQDALIEKLEADRKHTLRLPFGVEVPPWTGYVAAAAGGLYVGSKL